MGPGPLARAAAVALLTLAVSLTGLPGPAKGGDSLIVAARGVADHKAVFATVESASVVPARARIAGLLAELAVDEGSRVARGERIAAIGDEKLALQIGALEARIAALSAEREQALIDLRRIAPLAEHGVVSSARLDATRTALTVAESALRAANAERDVVRQQLAEGAVLAPAAGRVLAVPLTVGSVVMPGETIVLIADETLVLRLRVPERHARFLAPGDPVRIDGLDLGRATDGEGAISLVYPRIEDGRVVADATVPDLGDYHVGQRVRVWISAGERPALVIPEGYLTTRFGIDTVTLQGADGGLREVPVQRGAALPVAGMPDGIEILSGIRPGDTLVRP